MKYFLGPSQIKGLKIPARRIALNGLDNEFLGLISNFDIALHAVCDCFYKPKCNLEQVSLDLDLVNHPNNYDAGRTEV